MEDEKESVAWSAGEGDQQAAPATMPGRYAFDIDLDSDSTHARVVRLVGSDRRVLELGPATGYMSQVFRERGCSVVGIEVDPDMAAQAALYCENVIVGDLDSLDLDAALGSDRFEVIVAADVLEHLKDPLSALRRLRQFLVPGGFFVISLPNVAHASVRLALLGGRFPYQRLGLLDETHLRFFTRESVDAMLEGAELAVAQIYHQHLRIDASEVPFDRSAVPADVIAQLEGDPDARIYQFVIKAVPFETPGLEEMQRRMRELAHDNARLRVLEPHVRELEEALAAIGGREGQLRASLIDLHEQLLQRDEQLRQLRQELLPLKRIVDRIRSMPLGRLYLKVRRLQQVASMVARRAEPYRAALRKK
jgi:2-polyprenyl-3-methyl-5-hydroxy-6-metoxy-1,4-benzoquinol methylase